MFTPEEIIEGKFILLNKPMSWTSHDVVARLRGPLKHFTSNKKLKVGHAGTLDPLATGLLIMLTGKATKRADETQNLDKEYTGTITLGGITESYDRESPVMEIKPVDHITEDDIYAAAKHLTGAYLQLPPVHSSIKIQGRPAYSYAREGEEMKMRPRPIEIFALEITAIRMPEVDFRVHCSKGTYIRSLAHDLGQHLGCGGYLSALCRTRIGTFNLADAYDINEVIQFLKEANNTTEKQDQ